MSKLTDGVARRWARQAGTAAVLSIGLAVAALATLIWAPQGTGATEPSAVGAARIEPQVRRAAQSGGLVPVIVVFRQSQKPSTISSPKAVRERRQTFDRDAAVPMAMLAEAVAQGRAGRLEALWIIHGAAVDADASVIEALARRPDVLAVVPNRRFAAPPAPSGAVSHAAQDDVLWNLDMIHAPEAWERLNLRGEGVTVALIDTGADYHHPALTQRYRGYRGRGYPDNTGNWWCPRERCGEGSLYPADATGHGTHVLGTILGEGSSAGNPVTGVAPAAQWIAAAVCGASGCEDRWIYAALGWILEEGTPRADVINMSLERNGPTDWVMKQAIDTLAEAGVITVVASGNDGQVKSPGSFTSTVTVGALDDQGGIPIWSGRGLSPWFERKPDVVAPGIGVVSTVQGGGTSTNSGTSMASPHVAGVAALMRQAKPGLSPAEAKSVMHRTATSDGAVPDKVSGWGTVNAYGATAALLEVATLHGWVKVPSGAPPAWPARIEVTRPDGLPVTSAQANPDGSYQLAIAAGEFVVTVSAFGYLPQTRPLTLAADEVRRTDFVLDPRSDGGWINGTVVDRNGVLLDGIVMLDGTPVSTSVQAGFFAIGGIPPGRYVVRVHSPGQRVGLAEVEIPAGGTMRVDLVLDDAPRMLLVDGDAWQFSGALAYYADSLDRLGYIYDTHRILDASTGRVPLADEMAEYEVVIWSQAVSSPGFVRAGAALDAYLVRGGRLILAGQDVACTDSGNLPCGTAGSRQRYLSERLFVEFVEDNSPGRVVNGAPGTPLEGISFALSGGDSLDNLAAPDVLDVSDHLRAEVAGTYDTGGGAVTYASMCLGYRAFLLGFGLESVATAVERDVLLAALIDGLEEVVPPRLIAGAEPSNRLAPLGATADYTVTLFHTGPDLILVTPAVSSVWPAALLRAGLAEPLTEPVQTPSCRAVPFGVRVTVPADAGHAVSNTATIEVESEGGLRHQLELVTRTPAPVLLIDGDSFEESEAAYRQGFASLAVPYDVWEVSPVTPSGRKRVPPTLEILSLYPVVVWFTGYNPFASGQLNETNELMLASYLEGGGRLLLSSEDYLDYRGASFIRQNTRFRREFLGVEQYIQNFGADEISGSPSTRFEDLKACTVRPSGESQADYFADRLFPRVRAIGTLVGNQGQIVATQFYSGPFKSAFLAFDAGKIEPRCMDGILAGNLDWFSLLTNSALSADRSSYASGDTVELASRIANEGPRDASIRAVWHVPAGATLVNVPLGWAWDATQRTLNWSGPVPAQSGFSTDVALILDADLGLSTAQSSALEIEDGEGLSVRRAADWRVNVADLFASDKSVVLPPNRTQLEQGEMARYTVAVRNRGSVGVDSFIVTDTLPHGLRLVERSITKPTAVQILTQTGNLLVWQGTVGRGGEVSVSYDAEVVTAIGGPQRNVAEIRPTGGEVLVRTATVMVRPNLLLPWLSNKSLLPRR